MRAKLVRSRSQWKLLQTFSLKPEVKHSIRWTIKILCELVEDRVFPILYAIVWSVNDSKSIKIAKCVLWDNPWFSHFDHHPCHTKLIHFYDQDLYRVLHKFPARSWSFQWREEYLITNKNYYGTAIATKNINFSGYFLCFFYSVPLRSPKRSSYHVTLISALSAINCVILLGYYHRGGQSRIMQRKLP